MDDLIEALTIFRKYKNEQFPTHCEHDVMWIMGVTNEEVSDVDRERLEALGFFWSDSEGGAWKSFKFGSA